MPGSGTSGAPTRVTVSVFESPRYQSSSRDRIRPGPSIPARAVSGVGMCSSTSSGHDEMGICLILMSAAGERTRREPPPVSSSSTL